METSPSKRRVLGTLDANVQSPATNKSLGQLKTTHLSHDSGNKRSLEEAGPPPAKRVCTPVKPQPSLAEGEATPAHDAMDDTASPEASSVFDNSAVDVTTATCTTELDAEVPPPSPPRLRRPTLTREEARQKAEILRLRLGLAGYKLRTGQENVPLERLQVRRIPDSVAPRPPRSSADGEVRAERRESATSTTEADTDGHHRQRQAPPVTHAHPSPAKALLPRLPPAALNTPTRTRFDDDERLTSSAIRGGAAKGLLSLSRG